MSEEAEVCCCCAADLQGQHEYVKFRYQVPGKTAEQVMTAAVCPTCAQESDTKVLFPVIEALLNARIIRMEYPDLKFTP